MALNEAPILMAGDPSKGPASFTRFVVPFAYEPELLAGPDSAGPHYREASTPDEWRKRYFTQETRKVLYDRARWLTLTDADGGWRNFTVRCGGRDLPVRLSPPALVLFEWPRHADRRARPELDPLQTGLLVLEAWFPNEVPQDAKKPVWDLESLLQFNELFRYRAMPYEAHPQRVAGERSRWQTTYQEHVEEHLRGLRASLGKQELDPYLGRWAWLLQFPVSLDGSTYRFMPPDALEEANRDRWLPYADDRAFVWTCALVEGGADGLAVQRKPAEELGAWIRLLNVDQPGASWTETMTPTAFEGAWVAGRTYKRWEQFGTLYGFNWHSGAMLDAPRQEPPTWRHFQEMYFDQTLLLLYLRVTTFRFSQRLTAVTEDARDGGRRLRDVFFELRQSFTDFTNLYQFPLLSNQEQGIEMYSKQRPNMDVDELFNEVQREIESSHELLEMEEDRQQTKAALALNTVATVALAMGLAFSFLGMSIIVGKPEPNGVLDRADGPWRLFAWVLSGSAAFFLLLTGLVWWRALARLFTRVARRLSGVEDA